jgi:hypothetical protein
VFARRWIPRKLTWDLEPIIYCTGDNLRASALVERELLQHRAGEYVNTLLADTAGSEEERSM